MNQTLVGDCGFDDAAIPAAGKSVFGMDTLTRKLAGHRTLLAAFLATLAQGQTYASGGVNFYLQSWEPDDATPEAGVTLHYKGLRSNSVTEIESEIIASSGSTSANFSTENGGKGRVYRKEVVYGTGGQSNVIIAEQDIYTTGASMEFIYDAAQSTYRYISVGKPNAPSYSVIDIQFSPQIKRARVSTADGSIYGESVPFAIGPALVPGLFVRVVGFFSRPVIGSPYWECTDVVRQELG